jgi:NRAMP (natural resistance-associated macrophage protein)-like metal ion transporter
MSERDKSSSSTPRRWYQRVGPGLITACVVIGPGSIVTSSIVGANHEYSRLWVVVVAVAFMMVYMTMGARLGVVASKAPGDLVRDKAGKGLAAALGICVFFISAAFQSGNNIGVAAAFEAFIDNKYVIGLLVVVFNIIAISFLFAFRNLYQVLERVMMCLVAVMLISFSINLVKLRPDLGAAAKGMVIPIGVWPFDLALLGLVGTTFVITAAYYQAYLVRQKGWQIDDLQNGLIDARVGSIIMAVITIVLMSTAAAGLYTGKEVTLGSPVDVAVALQPTFGQVGKIVFCVGLFSAAYSSFLVNSMIGGFMAADGLGLGSKPSDIGPRILTTVVLLTGMTVGLAAIVLDFDRTPTIIAAQAVTVVGAPLVAGVLLWLTSRRDIMGEHVNGPVTQGMGGIGFILLLAMAGRTAFVELPKKVDKYLHPQVEQVDENEGVAATGIVGWPTGRRSHLLPANSIDS